MSVYEQAFLLSTYLDHKDEISTSSKLWIGLTDAGVSACYNFFSVCSLFKYSLLK